MGNDPTREELLMAAPTVLGDKFAAAAIGDIVSSSSADSANLSGGGGGGGGGSDCTSHMLVYSSGSSSEINDTSSPWTKCQTANGEQPGMERRRKHDCG